MDTTSPRSSTSSDSFASGRSSPINGFDSSAALILVADAEDGTPAGGVAFDFSSEDDDTEDESDLQLERLRNSAIPPLSTFSVFLYLLSPFTKLGALLLPSVALPLKLGVPAFVVFALLSAFARQIWYMLARYVRRADLEEIVLETFARGRGKEGRRMVLRQLVRFFVGLTRVLVATLYLRCTSRLLLYRITVLTRVGCNSRSGYAAAVLPGRPIHPFQGHRDPHPRGLHCPSVLCPLLGLTEGGIRLLAIRCSLCCLVLMHDVYAC